MNKLLIFIFLISPAVLFGQGKPIPINVSFLNESTAIPFTRIVTTPVHPGIQTGTELIIRIKNIPGFFRLQILVISTTSISHKELDLTLNWDMNIV